MKKFSREKLKQIIFSILLISICAVKAQTKKENSFVKIHQNAEKSVTDSQICRPFISQVYVNSSNNDRFIEIKNKSGIPFSKKTYFIVAFDANQNLNARPKAIIDIGAMNSFETKVLGNRKASNPSYALNRMIKLPENFSFTGKEVLIITTNKKRYAYAKRVDLVGDFSNWCKNTSLVRSTFANKFPRIDAFETKDWVSFELDSQQLTNGKSLTNAVLGAHNFGVLEFDVTNSWREAGLPVNSSFPDKSRIVYLNNDYSLERYGNLYVGYLNVHNGITLTVPKNKILSTQTEIKIYDGATLDVKDGGEVIIVNNSKNAVIGPELVCKDDYLIFNNSMRTTNTTNTFARMANNTVDEKTKIWIAIKESTKEASFEAGIAFLDKGDDKFNENEDVKCFYGNPLNIYTIADKTDLVINALSKFDDNKMIALGFNNFTESNRLTISIAKTTAN